MTLKHTKLMSNIKDTFIMSKKITSTPDIWEISYKTPSDIRNITFSVQIHHISSDPASLHIWGYFFFFLIVHIWGYNTGSFALYIVKENYKRKVAHDVFHVLQGHERYIFCHQTNQLSVFGESQIKLYKKD